MTSLTGRIISAVDTAGLTITSRVLTAPNRHVGVIYELSDGHELSVMEPAPGTIVFGRYDADDNLIGDEVDYSVNELLPGDKVLTADDVVRLVTAEVRAAVTA